MIVSQIAALSLNRAIGLENKLPWHIPEDLKYFRSKTAGHICVMGRKTFQSIGSKPLPKRLNIVISRDSKFREQFSGIPNLSIFSSIEDAIAFANTQIGNEISQWPEEIFICGGGEIYKAAMARTDRLYLTEVQREVPGDAFYPEVSQAMFRESSRDKKSQAGPSGELKFDFIIFDRIRK
jgi:dihydrofolate reductase